MRCLILANGDYGPLEYYKKQLTAIDMVLCADGGANYACQMNLIPDYIIGDMDSIDEMVKDFYKINEKVCFKSYPKQKDFTDTQLTIGMAEDLGATEIIFFGTIGKRLDHTLANLYSGIDLCSRLKAIVHYSPELSVHLVSKHLVLSGNPGQVISLLALSDNVKGLSICGVEYPLDNVVLQKSNPYAISNILTADKTEIILEDGVIAVFHYYNV